MVISIMCFCREKANDFLADVLVLNRKYAVSTLKLDPMRRSSDACTDHVEKEDASEVGNIGYMQDIAKKY